MCSRCRCREAGDDAIAVRFSERHDGRQRPSLLIAAGVGGFFAAVVGLPLMRLSGLAAGIATFGVLEITHNVLRFYEKIGPGLNTFSSVPETTGLLQAGAGAGAVIVIAFAYQRSRFGRLLRATREDAAAARAVGISVYRQRLIAFALSGALAGFAGGLYVHLLPINTEVVYLELTFITLAQLVVGGMTSLWGAVVGALAVSGLDSLLAEGENGLDSAVGLSTCRRDAHRGRRCADGARPDLRPSGLTGGRELTLDRFLRRQGGPHEGLHRRLRRRRLALRGQPRQPRRVEVWAYDLDEAHVEAINMNGLQLTGAGEVVGRPRATTTRPSCRYATSASSRRRPCTPRRRSRRPRTHSPRDPSRRFRTVSATRRRSPRTCRG